MSCDSIIITIIIPEPEELAHNLTLDLRNRSLAQGEESRPRDSPLAAPGNVAGVAHLK